MIKKILAVSLFLIYLTISYSQKHGDYELFMDGAKEFSNLYRGAAPLNYKFKYTGTYFAYSDKYVYGDVYFNDKLYKDVLLNLNGHLDELYVFAEENGMAVMLNKNFVERFTIGDRHYINLKFRNNNHLLQDGYYEILWCNDTDSLIKKTTKKYEERINQLADLGTGNKIERIFTPSNQYYLLKENLAKQIKRASQIRAIYGVNRGALRKHIRDKELDLRLNKDVAFKSIVEFINSSLLPASK